MDQDIVDVVMKKMMMKKNSNKQSLDGSCEAEKSRSGGSSQNIPLPAPQLQQLPPHSYSEPHEDFPAMHFDGVHFARKQLSSIEEEMSHSRFSGPQQPFVEHWTHPSPHQHHPQPLHSLAQENPAREASYLRTDYSQKAYVSSSSNLSAQDSKQESPAEPQPISTSQQYELNMLELKKMKLLEKVASLESRIHEATQGVTHKQVELTSLAQSCEEMASYKHYLMDEFARMQEVSEQRVREVWTDLKESEEEAARVAKLFQDEQREDQGAAQDRLNALEDQYQTEILEKERQVQEIETDIARDSEQIQLCRERMTYLNDNIKSLMIERVREFSKLEKAQYDNQEKSLAVRIAEEEARSLQLQELEASCRQALSVGAGSIEQQRAKAEKIIQSLRQAFDKLLPELKRHRLEFEQLAQREQQARQANLEVAAETQDLKQAHLELLEALELLPGYLAERSRRRGQLPFSTNKSLNMVISLDNIYLSEIEDFEQKVGKLTQKFQSIDLEQNKRHLRTEELKARIGKDRDRLRSVFSQGRPQENPPAAATN